MIKECNLVIERALNNPLGNGWAEFILHEQLRKVKLTVTSGTPLFRSPLSRAKTAC